MNTLDSVNEIVEALEFRRSVGALCAQVRAIHESDLETVQRIFHTQCYLGHQAYKVNPIVAGIHPAKESVEFLMGVILRDEE